jgi:aminopeptidase N
MRTDLQVPYSQKDEARRLGARWDAAKRLWYIEDAENLSAFLRWIPERLKRPHEQRPV